jgi:hypothetical protein
MTEPTYEALNELYTSAYDKAEMDGEHDGFLALYRAGEAAAWRGYNENLDALTATNEQLRQCVRTREQEAIDAAAETDEARAELARCNDRLAWLAEVRPVPREESTHPNTITVIDDGHDHHYVPASALDAALQQCAKVAGLVELWTKRCGEWRANSQLHSPDIAVARAYEIAASELGMALATDAPASPAVVTGTACDRCDDTRRVVYPGSSTEFNCPDCTDAGPVKERGTGGEAPFQAMRQCAGCVEEVYAYHSAECEMRSRDAVDNATNGAKEEQ